MTVFGCRLTIDALGLRAAAVPPPQEGPAGTPCRVLVPGDLAGFGYGVDDHDMFTRRLADAHGPLADSGRRGKIINGSCEGYDTSNEFAWYRKVGRAFAPAEV